MLAHVIDAELATMMPDDAREAIASRLRAEEQVARDEGVETSGVCSVGRAWEMIVEEARTHDADLVIVGARGHTPYSRFFLGSTADRVIRTATIPVLTVHPTDIGRHDRIRTILAPMDFSDAAVHALDAALALARPVSAGLKVVLLHACHTPVEYATTASVAVVAGEFAETQRLAQTQLEEMAERLRSTEVEVEALVSAGYAASAIEVVAEEVNADLIAMGTIGRSGIRHVLLGSVAERVLHHASCPVLTLRRPEP